MGRVELEIGEELRAGSIAFVLEAFFMPLEE
jgi:hypothetical protein